MEMSKCTKPKLRKGNFGITGRVKIKYRVTGAKLSKSDYSRKLEAKSDLKQRKEMYKNKCH